MPPASGFSVMKWRVTPVSVSPLTSTQLTGARPRYFGSSEPWRFIAPSGGGSGISFFSTGRGEEGTDPGDPHVVVREDDRPHGPSWSLRIVKRGRLRTSW